MNLWITKIGRKSFTGNEIDRLEKLAGKLHTLSDREITHYKTSHIHYISFTTAEEFGFKKYNSSKADQLFAYSGLPVPRKYDSRDYRNVTNLKKYFNNYEVANNEILGQYALISASDDQFDCFPDFMGLHKVFYSELPNGEILISNSVRCIQLIKGSNLNYDFYVNWIAFGGIYGYETEDKNIYSLPEFGQIKWSSAEGLKIDIHSNLSSLIIPNKDLDHYITETVSDFKNSIKYLTEFHKSVLPLSGGYDSRLILEIFTLFDSSSLTCYTYPDNENDVIYAKKVARHHNIKHEVLKPEKNLEEIEANNSFFFPGDAFQDYSKVFGFQFRQQKMKYSRHGLNVLLKGDGGDTPTGFGRYSQENKHEPLNAINYLVNKSLISGLLKPHVEELFQNRMNAYYTDKYLDFLKFNGATYNLASIYYIIERFGNYQSHKLINGYQLNDIYLPYANQNFIKAVFSSPESKLIKSKSQSLHHILHRELLGDNAKAIHYADGIHWDANKLQRIEFRIRKMAKNKFKISEPKYSKAIRNQFFEKNKETFKDIILSSRENELWNFFDFDKMKKSLLSDSINSNQKKAIFRIVPLLEKNI